MKSFRQLISEGKYPTWTRLTAIGLTLRVQSLTRQIESEKDPKKQMDLIAKQNNLIAIMSGMGIGIPTGDKQLMTRMKQMTVGNPAPK